MSAIGSPLVSTSLLVSSPTSPFGSFRTVYPVFFSNCRITLLDIAHESWVATTTCFEEPPDPVLPPSEQPASARADSAVTAVVRARRPGNANMLHLPVTRGG